MLMDRQQAQLTKLDTRLGKLVNLVSLQLAIVRLCKVQRKWVVLDYVCSEWGWRRGARVMLTGGLASWLATITALTSLFCGNRRSRNGVRTELVTAFWGPSGTIYTSVCFPGCLPEFSSGIQVCCPRGKTAETAPVKPLSPPNKVGACSGKHLRLNGIIPPLLGALHYTLTSH